MERPHYLMGLIFSFISASLCNAEPVMEMDQAKKAIASMVVLSEICANKYPNLKVSIDSSWEAGFDKATYDWFVRAKSTDDFQKLLAETRTEMTPQSNELAKQCQGLYGTKQ
jgi:hypothetical protein